MAISLGDAVVTFRADLTDLNKSIGTATRAMKKDFGNLMGVAKDVGYAFTAMGAGITGGLLAIVKTTANAGDEIHDLAIKTGMGAEAVSKWGFALGQSGGSLATLEVASKGMSKSMDAAHLAMKQAAETANEKLGKATGSLEEKTQKYNMRLAEEQSQLQQIQSKGEQEVTRLIQQGASIDRVNAARERARAAVDKQISVIDKLYATMDKELSKSQQKVAALSDEEIEASGAAEAYQRLHINLDSLMKLTPEERFKTLAFAVADVSDANERAALSMKVFGKSGMDMLPVLAEGRAGLQAMFDEAERAGAVFTDAEAAMGDQFNDALGSLTASLQGAGKEIAIALIPSLIEMIGWVKETVISVKDWIAAHPVLTEWILKIGGGIGALMAVLGPFLIILPGIATALTGVSAAFAALDIAAAPVILTVLAVVAAIAALVAAGWYLYKNWDEVVAYVTDLWELLKLSVELTLQKIGEKIAEGMQLVVWAFTNPWDAVAATWDAVKNYFMGWWESITGFFQAGWDFVADIISKISEGVGWVADQIGFGFGEAGGAVPKFASGGTMRQSGLAIVGEQGPELVHLPAGARVSSARDTAAAMGGNSVNMGGVTINVHGVNDPRAIAEQVGTYLERAIQNKLAARGLRLQRA